MPDWARSALAGRPPTRAPPGPRVLKAMIVPRGEKCPPEIMALWVPGAGYAVCWELVTQRPIRRWSPEAKAAARLRNLRQRMERKFPLFAEGFIADELARRPGYFSAEQIAKE
jgi:hypothetical protein